MSNKWENLNIDRPEMCVQVELTEDHQTYLFKNLVKQNEDGTFSFKFGTDVYKKWDIDNWELEDYWNVLTGAKIKFKTFNDLFENFKELRVYDWVVNKLWN